MTLRIHHLICVLKLPGLLCAGYACPYQNFATSVKHPFFTMLTTEGVRLLAHVSYTDKQAPVSTASSQSPRDGLWQFCRNSLLCFITKYTTHGSKMTILNHILKHITGWLFCSHFITRNVFAIANVFWVAYYCDEPKAHLCNNHYLDMSHLWGGWIMSTKQKCSPASI